MNNEQHQNTHTSDAPAIPSPFQKKTCWHALTGVSILVMLGIAAFVIFEVVELLGFLEPVLLPILIAAVVAYLLEPIVSWLVRLKFSRPWAVVTVMFAALAVLVGFGATILPPLIRQTDELIDNRMELWDKTSELIDSTIEIPFISRTIDSVYSTSLRELNASHYTEAEVHEKRPDRPGKAGSLHDHQFLLLPGQADELAHFRRASPVQHHRNHGQHPDYAHFRFLFSAGGG